jgi:trans-aconitate 2-methyltransferase
LSGGRISFAKDLGMQDWSAGQYLKFEDQRTRPVRDLLGAVPDANVRRACDLGCGPGNSTEALLQRFPAAEVVGVDSSPDMIATARARLPAVRFELADAASWAPGGPVDLILSNATLHWLPDHASLFPRLASLLAPGGTLAVQVPDNLDEPCQRAMWEVAAGAPWGPKLAGAREVRTRIGSPSWFYGLLRPACARVDIWRTVYHHPLAGPQAVTEWFQSTGLRPYLAALEAGERADYLRRYREAVAAAYPVQPDGSLLLAFPRLFIVASR